VGVGVFVSAAFLNHDCNPTCEVGVPADTAGRPAC